MAKELMVQCCCKRINGAMMLQMNLMVNVDANKLMVKVVANELMVQCCCKRINGAINVVANELMVNVVTNELMVNVVANELLMV